METKLYVGNIPYDTTESELRQLFAEAGTVTSVAIPTDRSTDRPRGFAFVEMSTAAEAQKAISMLNGHMLGGRQMRVNVSEPREGQGGRDRRGPRTGGMRY